MPFILPFATTPPPRLENAQVGDTAHRMLAGVVPMDLRITELTDKLIICGPWAFNRLTGAEIDEELSISPSHLTGITPAKA